MPRRERLYSSSSAGSRQSEGGSVFSYSSVASTPTAMTTSDVDQDQDHFGAPGRLPCEFVGYGLCNEDFAPDDIENWINHIVSEHFRAELPEKALCWFCDTIFDNKQAGNRRTNFKRRMKHIREHIVNNGMSAYDMRPDHFVNKHLWKFRLIPEGAYNYVRRYSEGPSCPWVIPHDAGAPGHHGGGSYNDGGGYRRHAQI